MSTRPTAAAPGSSRSRRAAAMLDVPDPLLPRSTTRTVAALPLSPLPVARATLASAGDGRG
ncbi:hypothetical protein [Kitasatospora sp. NPDC097643]|uniref:hypothetical protein n=1 Tax=Kitasatospora sp. NPDC097643 TaxID=3157230 RepID=UPI0033262812